MSLKIGIPVPKVPRTQLARTDWLKLTKSEHICHKSISGMLRSWNAKDITALCIVIHLHTSQYEMTITVISMKQETIASI